MGSERIIGGTAGRLEVQLVAAQTFDFVVIGAGIVGASVAFRLATAGARVGVASGGRPGAGTSGATFAWLNSAEKFPLGYHQLNVAGMEEWRVLADELSLSDWVRFDGSLTWAEDDSGAAALWEQVARLRRWGYAVEVLSVAHARRHWAPDLVLDPERVHEVVGMPREGWVAAVPVIHALLERAARARAVIRDARVTALTRDGDRVTGVVTDKGEEWSVGTVVNCAGPLADEIATMAGVTLPLHREPGTLLITEPVPTCLRPAVHTPVGRFRPDGGGRVLILPRDDLTPSAALDRVAAYLPALKGARIETTRVGVRPMPVDGHPIVGSIPGLSGFALLVAHSGITLGPLLGRLLAQELLGGDPDPRLAPYRPDRFFR